MTSGTGQCGSASGEYLAVIAVVVILFGALLVFRPHTVSRHVPVDVITPVARLLGHPLDDTRPSGRSGPPTAPRPTKPRKRHLPPTRPRIMLPEWWSR